MLTSRQRVMNALNFQATDRIPKDLGGMRSTSISAFSYPSLVAALGLPPRLPRIEDAFQMLALPDLDVLDALGCDVVTIADGVTNAIPQPERWHRYRFNGRLDALVQHPRRYRVVEDGAIMLSGRKMVSASYVFDEPHGGQPLHLDTELPMVNLKAMRRRLARQRIKDADVVRLHELCRQVRESTDRAVFLNEGALNAPISIHAYGGLAVFPLLCLLEPDYVAELHAIAVEHTLYNIRALLPEIEKYVDVIMIASDDWGTQNTTFASPQVYRDLFLPYRRAINDACHALAPNTKLFLHSCGAIYDLIEPIIESGFDILNPVQWPAGGHSYSEWKAAAGGRLALWGGGVNAQHTLQHGTVAQVRAEAKRVSRALAEGGGYVFANIHNLLAEVSAEKVIALYRAAE
ncbi:MAG: hypothetical protein GXY52_03365 [Chloroflexi bacterium]|nr:hypothetical protein [Chloroflexota bacterium]